MAKEKKQATEKTEKEYIIPLREKCLPVPRYKKANKAVKTIKEFLARHMKIYDRDLNKIKIDKYVNEAVWARGIKKPLHKVKVKAIKEGDIVRVELAEFSDKLKFKKAKEEQMMAKAEEGVKKKKPVEEEKPETKSEQDVKEEKEKKSAVVEAGAKGAKKATTQMKHQAGGKAKQKTQPIRKALAK